MRQGGPFLQGSRRTTPRRRCASRTTVMIALVSANTLDGLWRADQTGRTTPPCCLAPAPVRGAAGRGTLYAAADAGGGEARNGELTLPPYPPVSAACTRSAAHHSAAS